MVILGECLMVTVTRSTDPEKVAKVKKATEEREKKDAVLEKLVEKKRRIEKTARVLLRIEYQNKIDDFLQNKLPLIENNELSPSVAKALLEVEMDEKIESLIESGEAVNMVLTEIPTLVDNILESNINQLQLLESKTKITDEDISAIEDQSEREERVISPEEIRKSHGIDI